MSISRFPSARECFCTSAAAALALAVAAPGAAALAAEDPLRTAERALAAESGLYLVVTPEPPAVAVKARGLALDRLPLDGVAVVLRRAAGGPRPEPVALPAVWRVSEEGAAEPQRKLVAPAELKPAPAEGGADPEEDREAEPAPAAAPAPEDDAPEPPAEYRIGFEGGWELWVGPDLPGAGPLARFAAAVAGGWRALWGIGPEPPGAVALAADAATARRLHHLFRAGTPVLVAAPAAAATAATPAGSMAAVEAGR